MRARPRVTIILPTYNCGQYLGSAIDSALRQTFRDFELLVLDNASTDDTPDVVRRFDDERLRYIRHPRNLGFAGNVQHGLELAGGAFIVCLGADDILEPPFLEHTVACLEANAALSFVHTKAVWIDEGGTPFGDSGTGWAPVTAGPQAFVDCFRYGFCFPSMVLRAAALRPATALETAWGDLADLSLFLRFCLAGDAGYVATPLIRYRVHSRSLSSAWFRRGRFLREHLRLLVGAFEWPEARARGLHRHRRRAAHHVASEWVRMAHLVREHGSLAEFATSFAEAVCAAPRIACYPGTWLRLVFGLLPSSMIDMLRIWKRRRWRERASRAAWRTRVAQGLLE